MSQMFPNWRLICPLIVLTIAVVAREWSDSNSAAQETALLDKQLDREWLAMLRSWKVVGPPKARDQDLPVDVSRQHVETITSNRHEYTIAFDGTVDGAMTRSPIGYSAFEQGWQPNRSVLIENVGSTEVRNPWLTINGRGDWQTLSTIAKEAARGVETERDKARAIYEFVRRQKFHACTWDDECSDAVKALNVFGYTLCGNQAHVLADLWRAAGLRTRRCYPVGHIVGEVFYDGQYHMMDSDQHGIYLLRDNTTIAAAEDIVRDHDLVKRTHTYGILNDNNRRSDEFVASLFSYEEERGEQFKSLTTHSMDLVLRPYESIEFRWDHLGKQYTAAMPETEEQHKGDGFGDLLGGWGPMAFSKLRNGKLCYQPDLTDPLAPRGCQSSTNITWRDDAGCFRPTSTRRPAQVTWQFDSPYVFVGARASATITRDEGAKAYWRYSIDGHEWERVDGRQSANELVTVFDRLISPCRRPAYRFWLQLALHGKAVVTNVSFDNDIQMAALSLPELTVGQNGIVYTDNSRDERQVRITHHWLERTSWHAPEPPATALSPEDGSVIEGTQVTFAWAEANDPDGDAIADYHFELSAHADMRRPLSPSFEKLISRTPFKGKPEYTLPYTGLLNPDSEYYWRVRAQDEAGVWGSWSRTFRFSARAPGVPQDLKLLAGDRGGLELHWRPSPQGREPVTFIVFGSDEKGFTVDDTEHPVFRGRGFVDTIEEYDARRVGDSDNEFELRPGNLIAQTPHLNLRVVGSDLEMPNVNRAFYRVVAIDEEGNESGPSDYVTVPSPYVVNWPASTARVGVPYQYCPQVIRSIGDLRSEVSYRTAYWNREVIAFTPINLPDGFRQDAETGEITGTPTSQGRFQLTFEVSIEGGPTTSVTQAVDVSPPSGE
jgi:hypothetical protein